MIGIAISPCSVAMGGAAGEPADFIVVDGAGFILVDASDFIEVT